MSVPFWSLIEYDWEEPHFLVIAYSMPSLPIIVTMISPVFSPLRTKSDWLYGSESNSV
jgi:hypothetical protein